MLRQLCPPYTPREESSPYGLGSDWDVREARWAGRSQRCLASLSPQTSLRSAGAARPAVESEHPRAQRVIHW